MSSISQLPYVCCVSCGNQLGHLFEHYYVCTKNLNDYHAGLISGKTEPGEIDTSLFQIADLKSEFNLWDKFLKGYYTWLQEKDDSGEYIRLDSHQNMTPGGLVMQGLLADFNLETKEELNEHLPFNFSGQDCVRICCKTALLTDNSKALY